MDLKTTNHYEGLTIDWLNDDVLLKIFDHLDYDDKIRLRRVCFRWKRLLEYQLKQLQAFRLGSFLQGGYNLTSGLILSCDHKAQINRQKTSTLFNKQLLSFPADVETQCFSVKRYDLLYRSLKFSQDRITVLSLGRINITYRLLLILTHNLPNLEHLELIACASRLDEVKLQEGRRLMAKLQQNNNSSRNLSPQSTRIQGLNRYQDGEREEEEDLLPPSLNSFNNDEQSQNEILQARNAYDSITIYNQNEDEFINMQDRLLRSRLLKNCDLVKQTRAQRHWPKLRHLLVKQCNLLNEFSLSLLIEITSQSLTQLIIESNQYLTGEFLNYCGPKLGILRVKYCPLLQVKFLEDLVKIRRLISPQASNNQDNPTQSCNNNQLKQHSLSNNHQDSQGPLRPLDSFVLRQHQQSFNQDIYCSL